MAARGMLAFPPAQTRQPAGGRRHQRLPEAPRESALVLATEAFRAGGLQGQSRRLGEGQIEQQFTQLCSPEG
eukprot:954874-Lingulodinium_polyedra.AAC.1